MSGTIAVVRCDTYDVERVEAAVARGFALLGGLDRFVAANERILLKPNLLRGSAPAKAVTTHPAVLRAVAKHLQAVPCSVSYGDSPGFGSGYTVARRAGLEAVEKELNLEFADFQPPETRPFPEGYLSKQFTVAKVLFDVDGIVSLPKLKTHALTRMTGAVKNQFGCIPGIRKGEFHARLPEMDHFAQMLVDLTRFVHPRLYVMDAIVAMEGNGPGSGDPRAIGALLFGTDPVAMDTVACRLMNLDPMTVPTIRWGHEIGLGNATGYTLEGDALDGLAIEDFKADRKTGSTTGAMNSVLARILKQLLTPRPVINPDVCTRCGNCVKVCPATPKALEFKDGKTNPPQYNYTTCIRCYCCQELCPSEAISVWTPPLGRIVHR